MHHTIISKLFLKYFPAFWHLYIMERLTLKNAEEIRAQIIAAFDTEDPVIQHINRLNIILLLTMKDGPSAIQIADLYGLARQTVTRWAKRLNEQSNADISVLVNKIRPGRVPKMTPEQIDEIDKILKKSPKNVGLKKDKWTGALLSSFLNDSYGIDLKTTSCQRWMRRLEDKKTKVPRR